MPLTQLLSGMPLEDLDRILDVIPDGILLIDGTSRIAYANAALEHMLGCEAGQVVGRSTYEFLDPSQQEESSRAMADLGAGHEGVFHRALRHASGQYVDVELKARRLPGGLICSVVRDVTDQRRRDEALRQSEERFRSAAEFSAIGMALVSLDGRWLSVNPALCRILGYSEHELLTKTFQEITHADDLALDVAKAAEMAAGQLPTYQVEKRYIKRDGSVVWGRLTVSLVHDARGAPLYFVSQVQDITEQRALAERALHAEKMEAIGRLAAGIAHDFNNVLAAIHSNGELIQMLTEDARVQSQAAAIVADASRAALVARQLQLFSRRHVSNPHDIALDEVINDTAPLLERLITRRARLVLDLQHVVVRADPQQVQQILLNLCVNARDAMPDGGAIEIGLRCNEVAVPAEQSRDVVPPGRYAVLSVKDSGTGIPDEVMPKLFEPFFTTKGAGGSGIGLATVDAIVHHHNGRIVVDTVVGAGTTFTIYLPLATDAAPFCEASAASSEPAPDTVHETRRQRTTHTILIVDDERSLREAASLILTRSNFHVATAASAEQALDYLESVAPDDLPSGILTDMTMPGMNGRELGDCIRRRWPDIPVTYMSGYSEDVSLQDGILASSRRFMAKPFTAEALVGVAKEMVEKSTSGELPQAERV